MPKSGGTFTVAPSQERELKLIMEPTDGIGPSRSFTGA